MERRERSRKSPISTSTTSTCMEPTVGTTTTMAAGMIIQGTTGMVLDAGIIFMEDLGCPFPLDIGMARVVAISTIMDPGFHILESTIMESAAGIISGVVFGGTIPGFTFISMAVDTIDPVASGLISRCLIATPPRAGICMMD